MLHIFPTTIRRRILRHLYLRHVRNAYLFKGVRQKFIDALLGVARIELFMPQAGSSFWLLLEFSCMRAIVFRWLTPEKATSVRAGARGQHTHWRVDCPSHHG